MQRKSAQRRIKSPSSLTLFTIRLFRIRLYQRWRCKVTSNPSDRPIWFVVAPLWFVDAAFCISNTQHLLNITSISTLFFQNPCTIQINVLPIAAIELVCIPLELQASHFFYQDLREGGIIILCGNSTILYWLFYKQREKKISLPLVVFVGAD